MAIQRSITPEKQVFVLLMYLLEINSYEYLRTLYNNLYCISNELQAVNTAEIIYLVLALD